jgi:hypothetical protein
VPGDDFAVAHGSAHGRRRMESAFNNEMPETLRDYRATTQNNPVPQISHETGQWYVYPDLGEIAKYTGLLRPVTLEYFRDMAEKEGVLAQVPSFMDASGRLSLLLYKEEVERSLRTPKYGGFQLLGVQDSFDQGAAYVGCINSFLEPKPYVTAAAFHEFCGAQVPLARMAKRVWKNDETFAADLSLANYGPSTLVGRTVAWKLSDGERTVAEGDFGPMDLPNTGLCEIGSVKVPLVGITRATQLELCVSVPGTDPAQPQRPSGHRAGRLRRSWLRHCFRCRQLWRHRSGMRCGSESRRSRRTVVYQRWQDAREIQRFPQGHGKGRCSGRHPRHSGSLAHAGQHRGRKGEEGYLQRKAAHADD